MNTAERIGTLLFRLTRKELSKKEKAELERWRKRAAENEKIFQEAADPENVRTNYIRMLENKEALRKKMLVLYPALFAEPEKPARIFSISFSRVAAACLVILAAAGYCIFRPARHEKRYEAVLVSQEGIETALDDFQRGLLTGRAGIRITKNKNGEFEYFPPRDSVSGPDKTNRVYTPADCRYVLNLLQGVRIRLNENSSVIYPVNLFRDTLKIEVAGEVYIEVNRGASRPLLINLPGTLVEMESGQLNLNNGADSAIIRATLIGGAASVHVSEKEISLLPGQQVLVEGKKMRRVPSVDTRQIISWMK